MSDKHTPTPWEWRKLGDNLILVHPKHGILIVMDFIRKGMQQAEPRFSNRIETNGGLMIPLSEWEELPPDAEFIVRACNNFEDLLEACKNLIRDKEILAQDEGITACQCMGTAPDDITSPLPCSYCSAQVAIEKAEKGE